MKEAVAAMFVGVFKGDERDIKVALAFDPPMTREEFEHFVCWYQSTMRTAEEVAAALAEVPKH